MQYPFSCLPDRYAAIEWTLSSPRLSRYLPAANGDKHLALRLYIWNARLCESLYLPLQFAEVAARNAIHIPVGKRFGDRWYENPKFINLLPDRMKGELSETVRKQRKRRGNLLDGNHVIAGLSFGFWASLMTSAFDKQLWMHGVAASFPGATADEGREAIYKRLDRMRIFRNDVAHHVAIFDRKPQMHFQNALHITNWVCSDTHWLSAEVARVSRVINERPQ